ncbi:MAG: cytochrome c biogenesis protein CcsA [Burkholderiales bacterium]|nr:cytochrome c biogenesis protein CcsA [Phycisphaerae bacterium]
MRQIFIILATLTALVSSARAAGADSFSKQINIDPIRYMSLQDKQTIKTFDTYAREAMFHITGRSTLDGESATFTVLDMVFNPRAYAERNLIYIRNKPFRADFGSLSFIDAAEKQRILKEGQISLKFWFDPHTQQAMEKQMASATVKAKAIQEIHDQALALSQILDYPGFRGTLVTQAIVPPLDGDSANARPWQSLPDASMKLVQNPQVMSGAYAGSIEKMITAVQGLNTAWVAKDAASVNQQAINLAAAAESVNPTIYPSKTKRKFEVAYNALSRLTWPGAALYFLAFVFFLLAWQTELKWMYVTAWIAVVLAWLVHVGAIAIRWWLVQKNVGNWFEAIPIKNQFESVMFSAWFGTVVALVLETGLINRVFKRLAGWDFRKLHGQGIFGAAGAGIGMLSLVALFAVPFVTGQDIIGAGIRQNAGILMTYWLYVHVTLVTASYALIGMTFVIGTWYAIQYLANKDAAILQTLDAANLTMLQLAFWILGIGIITGALWADVSWGRPWAWDPKETFALITWIVYLIIVHIRIVTSGTNRALITSVLSIVGFGVMLFNWIGVNFFLVGLHSYA